MPRIASITGLQLTGLGITRILGGGGDPPPPPTGTDFTTRLNSVDTTGWVFDSATINIYFDNSDFLVFSGDTVYISETQSLWFEGAGQNAYKSAYQGLRTVTGFSTAGITIQTDVVNDFWSGGSYNNIANLRNGTGIGFISVL